MIFVLEIFSDEWFKRFAISINENVKYGEAARDWEGDIILAIIGDEASRYLKSGMNKIVILQLYHGKCYSIEFLNKIPQSYNVYVLEGKASVWESILDGNLDVISGILSGSIGLTGNIGKLTKYIQAARELVNSAKKIRMEY